MHKILHKTHTHKTYTHKIFLFFVCVLIIADIIIFIAINEKKKHEVAHLVTTTPLVDPSTVEPSTRPPFPVSVFPMVPGKYYFLTYVHTPFQFSLLYNDFENGGRVTTCCNPYDKKNRWRFEFSRTVQTKNNNLGDAKLFRIYNEESEAPLRLDFVDQNPFDGTFNANPRKTTNTDYSDEFAVFEFPDSGGVSLFFYAPWISQLYCIIGFRQYNAHIVMHVANYTGPRIFTWSYTTTIPYEVIEDRIVI